MAQEIGVSELHNLRAYELKEYGTWNTKDCVTIEKMLYMHERQKMLVYNSCFWCGAF